MKRNLRMNTDAVLGYCNEIDALTQAIRDEVISGEPVPPPSAIVEPGDDLQAALDAGGAIALAQGATFAKGSTYSVEVPGTSLVGLGVNRIESSSGRVLDIPCDVDDLAFADFAFAAAGDEAFLIGRNDPTQNVVDLAPARVRIARLTSAGHRGKRVFSVNGSDVELRDLDVRDVYSPDALDSQAICILNAPGPVRIEGGYLEAASENILVGGDTMKIPNCRPSGITIRSLILTKPLAWKEAGTPKVKNLIELKDGHHVLIELCDLSHCWASAQDGFGFMFTPTNGSSLVDVLVRRCRMWDVGGIVNVVGVDKSGVNQVRSQITFDGGDYRTNAVAYGGRGCFALVGNGPEWLIVDGCTISVDGTAFVEIHDKARVDLLRIVGCTWNYPKYGIRIGGYNHGEDYHGVCGSIVIEGNTITGAASSFKSRYPNNTYVSAYRFGPDAERLRAGVQRGDEGTVGAPRESD